MSKKKKSVPFHIKHGYKKWTSDEGYSFWARDKEDAKLYLKKTGLHLGKIEEVTDE